MSKIGKAFRALCWIVRKPALLSRVLTDEDTWRTYVDKIHHQAGGLPLVRMDQLIGSDPIALGPMTFLDGGSLPTDLMLLGGLAEGIEDCTYFEIGTWRGESVATVAPRATSCHTLCLSDEEMHHRGMHPNTIHSHMLFSGDLKHVIQMRGDSRNFDYQGLNKKFDLVFIDGDHHYDFLKSDTEKVFKYLVHANTVVVWHDYGFHPDQVRYEVMAAILDGVGPDRTGMVYHVAHTKSAIYTGKSLPSMPADFPCIPEEYYKTTISRHRVEGSGH
jgi:predicted O-methyltransferase YrrM